MTQADADRLIAEFNRQFGGDSEAEEVAPGQFRFLLISPAFSGLPQMRRQDMTWEVIERVLAREQLLDLTLVLPYAPDEIQLTPTA